MSTIKEKYAGNIVAAWDFRKGSLLDQSGNGWDATRQGSPSFATCRRGRSLRTNANGEGLTLGKILGTSDPIANLTIVASIVPTKLNLINRVVKKYAGGGSAAGSIDLDYQTSGVGRFLVATSGSVFKISTTPASTVKVGQLMVLGGVFNGTAQTVQVFSNGTPNTSVAFTESVIPAYDLAWEAFVEGTNTGFADCSQIIIFNVALTSAEMAQLYEEIQAEAHYDAIDIRHLDNSYNAYDPTGADSLPVYIANGVGWNESFNDETSGDLSNTGFNIVNAGFRVVNNGTPDGLKYIMGTGLTGRMARPSYQAYGTWEFDLYKTDTTHQPIIMFAVGTTSYATTAGQTGYAVYNSDSERIALYRLNGDTTASALIQSATDTLSLDTWYKIRVTRTAANLWTLSYSSDGGITYTTVGIYTDATYTTSNYCTVYLQTNNRIRNFKFTPYI